MTSYEHRLADFISDRFPSPDQAVDVLCQDHVGTYMPPFLCQWNATRWINCDTGLPLDAEIVGWREHVERGPSPRPYAGRLRRSARR